MKSNRICYSILISVLIATANAKPSRRQDEDVKEVETNANEEPKADNELKTLGDAAPNKPEETKANEETKADDELKTLGDAPKKPGENKEKDVLIPAKKDKNPKSTAPPGPNKPPAPGTSEEVYIPPTNNKNKEHQTKSGTSGEEVYIPPPNNKNKDHKTKSGTSDEEVYIPPSNDKNGEEPRRPKKEENCWVNLNTKKHFEIMDALDARHDQVRQDFQQAVLDRRLDDEMLEMMLQTRAAAERAVHNVGGIASRIPAGINLGGYGMMKLANSMLFFHRMKLRNDTNFRVTYLQNDIYNMVMISRLNLNDLLLYGSYERAITDKDALFYRPTFGELELLLKGVTYKMEGRFRLVQSRLVVEHVLSEMHMKDVLLMYYVNGSTECQTTEKLQPAVIIEFLERLKADLDMWLKDYFNDYLLYFGLTDASANHELHCYDKQKGQALNDFVDSAIKVMQKKLYSLDPPAANIKTPSFSIYSINGVQIRLHGGVIRGYDSFYRQSVATGRKEDKIRMADAVIAFSKLKIEYKYLAKINGRTPPLMGIFVLTADDLIAHLGITMVKDPEAVDLVFSFLRQVRPQSLVIEGAINRMVGNFKHVLENQIIALMTNALFYHIKQLSTLTRCEPNIRGHIDDGEVGSREDSGGGDSGEIKGKGPDYGISRNDSIEIEVPGDSRRPPKKMHIKYAQKLAISESILPGGDVIHENEKTEEHRIVDNGSTDDEHSKARRRKGV